MGDASETQETQTKTDLSFSSLVLNISDSHAMTRACSHVFQSAEERDEQRRLKLMPSSLSCVIANCAGSQRR